MTDFNKKHTAVSFRPLNFAVMLKVSKSQLNMRGFKVTFRIYDSSCAFMCIISQNVLGFVFLFFFLGTCTSVGRIYNITNGLNPSLLRVSHHDRFHGVY